MSNTPKNKLLRKNVSLDERGTLQLSASNTSSKHDFDFLQGTFNVHHKKLTSPLSQSNEWAEFDGSMDNRRILMGIGNIEHHYMTTLEGKPVEGFALRLFDPQTRLWSIYWADSQNGILDIPVVGAFEGSKGYFFANDHFKGREILLQFEWDAADPTLPVWKQGFSVDRGNTWEWNWYMYFAKAKSI